MLLLLIILVGKDFYMLSDWILLTIILIGQISSHRWCAALRGAQFCTDHGAIWYNSRECRYWQCTILIADDTSTVQQNTIEVLNQSPTNNIIFPTEIFPMRDNWKSFPYSAIC
jgi:hypothetical protein